MNFAFPLAFLFPLIVALALFFYRPPRRAVLFPSLQALASLHPTPRAVLRGPLLGALLLAALCAFTIALMRPQLRQVVFEPAQARNIILALDVSKSMATEDFQSDAGIIDRLAGVQEVVKKFIAGRSVDRIGIVVFGSNAFLQSPLTRDHLLLGELVDRLQVGVAGDGTEMGDGLALALKRISEVPQGTKTIILVTDGVNSSGPAKPLEAARIAQRLGVKIHTIGIGTKGMTRSPGFLFGAVQQAEFDEKSLKEIAQLTGGLYFHASDARGLSAIYNEIDALETSEDEEPPHEVVRELFPQALVWGLSLYLVAVVLNQSYFMKVP